MIEGNCSSLGHAGDVEASVCERPVGKEELLSFHDKYLSSGSGSKGLASASRIIPADISDKLASDIQKSARKVFRALRSEERRVGKECRYGRALSEKERSREEG